MQLFPLLMEVRKTLKKLTRNNEEKSDDHCLHRAESCSQEDRKMQMHEQLKEKPFEGKMCVPSYYDGE